MTPVERPAIADDRILLIEAGPLDPLDLFEPERPSVFEIVPAGLPTGDPAQIANKTTASRRRVVARRHRRKVPALLSLHRWRTRIAHVRIQLAQALQSTVRLTIAVALAFRSRAGQLAIGIAQVIRSTTGLAIQTALVLRSTARRFGILAARALRSTIERTIRVALVLRSATGQLAIGSARALQSAAERATQSTQAFRSNAARFSILVARAFRSTIDRTSRVALVLRSRIRQLAIPIARTPRSMAEQATRVARSLRSTAQLTGRVALALLSGAQRLTIGMAQAVRLAAQPTIQLARAFESPAQRLLVLALVVAWVTAGPIAGMIIYRQWQPVAFVQARHAAVQRSAATRLPSSSQATLQEQSTAPSGRLSALPTMKVVPLPRAVRDSRPRVRGDVQVASIATNGRAPDPPARGLEHAIDARAIQRVLNRYRDAFSILDAGAAKAVWPAVDRKALGLVFDGLKEQNFEFDSCRISVTDLRAEASCRGSAQYTHVRSRQPRTEPRQWQFALRKVNEDWLIDAVNSR